MNIEHLSHWSGQLNREMYVNRYGHAGIPVVVFASSGGSHNEYYDFGIIDACARFIEEGRVQFFTLSSVDSESWLCDWKNPHDRAEMHRAYERYVIEEAIPFIKHKTGWFDPMMTTGCSMGAYHALNFFLQHPDVFNKVIALSGVYDARFFVGVLVEMKPFTKILHLIISGTKMMAGLSIVTVRLKLLFVLV